MGKKGKKGGKKGKKKKEDQLTWKEALLVYQYHRFSSKSRNFDHFKIIIMSFYIFSEYLSKRNRWKMYVMKFVR